MGSIFATPQARHRLLLRVELHAGSAVESVGTATGNTLLVASKGEHRQRNGDGDVDANLSGFDVLLESRRRRSRGCEDGGTIAVLVIVCQRNRIVESIDIKAHEHRTEDFLFVAGHVWSDVGDDGRSNLQN